MPKNDENYDEVLKRVDQTEFGMEEPLFESAFTPTTPVKTSTEALPKKSPRIIWIGGIAGSVILIILGLSLWLFTQPMIQDQLPITGASPSPNLQPDTPEAARVKSLKQELEAGDPARPGFTFPQVDMTLTLDGPRGNR